MHMFDVCACTCLMHVHCCPRSYMKYLKTSYDARVASISPLPDDSFSKTSTEPPVETSGSLWSSTTNILSACKWTFRNWRLFYNDHLLLGLLRSYASAQEHFI